MKANELMIGNWVNANRSECVGDGGQYAEWEEYGKVTRIYDDDTVKLLYPTREDDWEEIDIKDLEPIPLTTEILEKNGWSQDIYSNESYDNEDAERLSLWVGEDGRNAWWWHVGVELVIPINYVHELQNAMTLCRIKKEIEL